MVTPAVEGIDLFKIAGRSISGWISSCKTRTSHTEQRWAMEKPIWEVVAGERN
jgi:hypothetical protein